VTGLAQRLLELHRGDSPLLMPNPWDVGSAVMFESLGFQALATTSSGFAATLGRLDGQVTRDEAIAHAGAVAEAVSVPVSGDLENCFADEPDGVAETVRLAAAAGLAGCSVEDYSGPETDAIYEPGAAAERVVAAVEAARAAPDGFVLTARAENHIHGRDDLAEAGVSRISVGGGFAYAALGAAAEAARELQETGTYGFWETAAKGARAAREAFSHISAQATGGQGLEPR
jgi:2-methylisocitrate lyase-like PEP mutase family enzyme